MANERRLIWNLPQPITTSSPKRSITGVFNTNLLLNEVVGSNNKLAVLFEMDGVAVSGVGFELSLSNDYRVNTTKQNTKSGKLLQKVY